MKCLKTALHLTNKYWGLMVPYLETYDILYWFYDKTYQQRWLHLHIIFCDCRLL